VILTVLPAAKWREERAWRERWRAPAGVEERVAEIIAAVREEGDAALLRLTRELDGALIASVTVGAAERARGAAACPPEISGALEFAAERITEFHRAQRWDPEVGHGPARFCSRPVASAGVYVPGGRASYPSSVLMNAIPARVAGVSCVVMASPPLPDGSLAPQVLRAAEIAGVDLIVRCGGAQAIAALAFGTESVPRVDRVVGPGNVWVTAAKRQVAGLVGIEGLAGPSEVVVIADGRASARLVALDLAAQMEHDPHTWAVLLTDSAPLATAVAVEMESLVRDLERGGTLAEAAAHCAAVVCSSLDEAVELSEAFAPEHLQVNVAEPARLLPRLVSAGSVFAGAWSPVPAGDYAAGPNHTLPTGGSARFASPLSVHDFLKRYSVLELDEAEFRRLAPAAAALARAEGLTAHAHALEERLRG
jgi:histidinol dehydrogenase